MTEAALHTVAELRAIVERRFPVYDVQADDSVVAFYVNVQADTVEANFDALKNELKRSNLIPILKYQGGEHSIFVLEKPVRNRRSTRVNVLLFIATLITTTLAGTMSWALYANVGVDVRTVTEAEYFASLFAPANVLWGFVFFAVPLILILGVHEMGHYVASRRHGVEASLPFFIPIPPFFLGGANIGTLGAFISMREPIPSKKALFDIGVSGPIAGFVVAIPVLLVGMFLMALEPVFITGTEGGLTLGTPLLYDLLAFPFGFADNQVIHPVAFAGWVGLFVTAINLLPAGQLDGGHMVSALLGDRARYFSYAAVLALIILGFGVAPLGMPGYTGWLVFAIVILFLGIQHPPTLNGVSELDRSRKLVALGVILMFVVCFTPVPIALSG